MWASSCLPAFGLGITGVAWPRGNAFPAGELEAPASALQGPRRHRCTAFSSTSGSSTATELQAFGDGERFEKVVFKCRSGLSISGY